jgi:hypothetical protein
MPVMSTAKDTGNILASASPIATRNKANALAKKNIPTKRRIKEIVKEKRLILDCWSSALTSSIAAKKISTKEATAYGSTSVK